MTTLGIPSMLKTSNQGNGKLDRDLPPRPAAARQDQHRHLRFEVAMPLSEEDLKRLPSVHRAPD